MDTITAMSQAECLALLAEHSLGRVAFTERAMPAIRPVNYRLVGSRIVLRTAGDQLAARLDGQVVAFEIDDVDLHGRTGWSVVVTGTARVLRDPGELARLDALAFSSWAGPDHMTPVAITTGDVQGRRIAAAPLPAAAR